MDFTQIVVAIILLGVGVIGYFLRATMDRLSKTEQITQDNSKEIELVRQENTLKHDYTTKEFQELKISMKDLTKELKELNSRLAEK